MGKKASTPAPPDYGPLAAASEKSAEYSYMLSKESLAWAKQQYKLDSKVVNRFLKKAWGAQDEQMDWARDDRARYEDIFQPLEEQGVKDARMYAADARRLRKDLAPVEAAMIRDAKRYGSQGFMEEEAGRAAAEVGMGMDAQRSAAISNLESFGINPSATRYAALDQGAGLARAAAGASAANVRRDQVRDQRAGYQDRAMGLRGQGDALAMGARSEAVNVGRGLPAQAMGAMGAGLAAGQAGVGARQAGTQIGSSTMGTPLQWQGAGNSALGMWGDILNTSYNNQLDAWKANQQASSGIGSLIGMGAGALFSKLPMLADGGEVPEQASPTEGVATDDVHAMLTAGEFVIPKDVVEWLGEASMHKLITKARKDMGVVQEESGAIPEWGDTPDQGITFDSNEESGIPDEEMY